MAISEFASTYYDIYKAECLWDFEPAASDGGGKHKIACQTRYGLFEPTILQFVTTNASAHFQGYRNNTIREALDDFASAY